MKTKIKSIFLVMLLVVFSVLVILPATGLAKVVEMPGYKSVGVFGPTCECGWWPPECGCIIEIEE